MRPACAPRCGPSWVKDAACPEGGNGGAAEGQARWVELLGLGLEPGADITAAGGMGVGKERGSCCARTRP